MSTYTKGKYLFNFQRWLTVFMVSLSIVLLLSPAEAAETAIIKYGIFQESISVSELSHFANTGELSSSLKAYLKMVNKEPEQLRQALTEQVKVNPVTLSKFLNTFLGEMLLDQVSQVIHTPSQSASREALRGALVTSALADGNIKLIEVIENYPTSEVYVEGDRLVEAYRLMNRILGKIPQLPF